MIVITGIVRIAYSLGLKIARSSIVHITMMLPVLRVQRGAQGRPRNNPRARPSDVNPKSAALPIR